MFNLSRRANVKVGIEMSDYCLAAQELRIPVAKIRGVDEVESAGSGFSLSSMRPKILFEGHLFYKDLKKKGLAVKAQSMEPSICYPSWTKKHYIGRDGEYSRLAKATELCHAFGISDGIALRSASWGRYQILGSNFIACGFDTVEEMVEAMFLDEDNHLEAFCEYIVAEGIDDELRNGNIVGFVRRYNGPGYARNNYHIKLPNAIRKFERQNVNCRNILAGQVVEVMPGIRDMNPGDEGFANTGLDDRYLDGRDNPLLVSDDEIDLFAAGIGDTSAAQEDSAGSNSLNEPAINAARPDAVVAADVLAASEAAAAPPETEPAPAPEEVKITREEKTDEGTKTVETVSKNEQDVNIPAQITEPEPYNKIGFFATIKKDLIAVTGGNIGFESLSTYAQQASGWPPWVIAIVTKLAVIALIAGAGYLIFRLVHFVVDTWKTNNRVREEIDAKTAVNRKDINWVKADGTTPMQAVIAEELTESQAPSQKTFLTET